MQENYLLEQKLNRKIKMAIDYSKAIQIIRLKNRKKIELILN